MKPDRLWSVQPLYLCPLVGGERLELVAGHVISDTANYLRVVFQVAGEPIPAMGTAGL